VRRLQGTPVGLTAVAEAHSFGSLLSGEVLHLPSAAAEPTEQAAHLPAVFQLATVPALRHADVLLAAHLRPSAAEPDAAGAHEADHPPQAIWLASEAVAARSGLVLIPAVSCLLAARSPFFRMLFSGRWRFAQDAQDVLNAKRLETADPGHGAAEPAGQADVCLPVVKLSADAGAVLQLLHWMATGRMWLLPVDTAAENAAASTCSRCYQLQTCVMAASLAGEWLMDPAQDAAENLVLDSSMAAECCRRSVVEVAYAVHMEGLAHRLAKRLWAQTASGRSDFGPPAG